MSCTKSSTEAVLKSSSFAVLVRKRNKVRFLLTMISLLFYGFFVGGIAVYNEWFAEPLIEGSRIPIGIYATVLVIVVMVLLEWLYVFISEKTLDPMQAQVKKELANHE